MIKESEKQLEQLSKEIEKTKQSMVEVMKAIFTHNIEDKTQKILVAQDVSIADKENILSGENIDTE